MSEPTKEMMDKWLITAMSHMKTFYEDNGIPWTAEDGVIFQAIRRLIENGPEVDEEFVERAQNILNPYPGFGNMHAPAKESIKTVLREAGVWVNEENE